MTDQSILHAASVEIISLDTLKYKCDQKELSAYIERLPGKQHDQLFVDLSATEYWDKPKNERLDIKDRAKIAFIIHELLQNMGIDSTVEAGP